MSAFAHPLSKGKRKWSPWKRKIRRKSLPRESNSDCFIVSPPRRRRETPPTARRRTAEAFDVIDSPATDDVGQNRQRRRAPRDEQPPSVRLAEECVIFGNRLFDICIDEVDDCLDDELDAVDATRKARGVVDKDVGGGMEANGESPSVFTDAFFDEDAAEFNSNPTKSVKEKQRLDKIKGKQSANGKQAKKGKNGRKQQQQQQKHQQQQKRPVESLPSRRRDDGVEGDNEDDDDNGYVEMIANEKTPSVKNRAEPVEFKPPLEKEKEKSNKNRGKKREKPVKMCRSKIPMNTAIVKNLDRIICSVKGHRKDHQKTRMKGGEHGFLSLGEEYVGWFGQGLVLSE